MYRAVDQAIDLELAKPSACYVLAGGEEGRHYDVLVGHTNGCLTCSAQIEIDKAYREVRVHVARLIAAARKESA